MLRTKGGVFCTEEHQMMCIVGTARREDSALGMLLPAPPERNIRQSYTADVVTLPHIKFNEHYNHYYIPRDALFDAYSLKNSRE